MRYLLTLLFILLIPNVSNAASYVCWNTDFRVVDRFLSIDGTGVRGRSNCLEVTRDKIKSLTRFHRFDASIIGTNDQKIRAMTQAEKDSVLAQELSVAREAKRQRLLRQDTDIVKDRSSMALQKSDAEIDAISNLAEIKIYLKKNARYMADTNNGGVQ